MSKKNKAHRVGTGGSCPKDGSRMGRFVHPKGWRPAPGRAYFTTWDKCRACGHIQHYEQFKVAAAPIEPEPIEESDREFVLVSITVGRHQLQTVMEVPPGLDELAQAQIALDKICPDPKAPA